jgi:hypothetical protein
VKDFYKENYKTIVEMSILSKAIYHQFNAILTKFAMTFFIELRNSILNFTWKYKRPQRAKTLLKRAMLEESLYLTSNYTKTAWY